MTNHRHTIIQRREGNWYPEPGREALLSELHALVTDPPKHRLTSVAIIADSNGGKSSLIERFLRTHPAVHADEAMQITCICLSMVGIERIEKLSIMLLEAIRAPDAERGTHHSRMSRFLKLAKAVRLRMIFMDEFHDVVNLEGKGRAYLRLIKHLMNEGILVVPAGVDALAEVLAKDSQLSSRFRYTLGRLKRIEDPSAIKALMCMVGNLPEQEISDAAVTYVLNETKGILGDALDLTSDTLIHRGDLTLASLRAQRPFVDSMNR